MRVERTFDVGYLDAVALEPVMLGEVLGISRGDAEGRRSEGLSVRPLVTEGNYFYRVVEGPSFAEATTEGGWILFRGLGLGVFELHLTLTRECRGRLAIEAVRMAMEELGREVEQEGTEEKGGDRINSGLRAGIKVVAEFSERRRDLVWFLSALGFRFRGRKDGHLIYVMEAEAADRINAELQTEGKELCLG